MEARLAVKAKISRLSDIRKTPALLQRRTSRDQYPPPPPPRLLANGGCRYTSDSKRMSSASV